MRILKTLLPIFLLAVPLQAGNIVVNPSFEYWTDSLGIHLPLGWLSSELYRDSSATRTDQSRTGAFAVRLRGSDTVAFVSTATIVRPGRHYRFSGCAQVPDPIGGSFLLEFLTLTGSPVGTPAFLPAYFSTGYREYESWVTAPDSAAFLSVSFATIPGATVYVDDVTLDDTTVSALVDVPGSLPAAPRVRKVVAPLGMLDTLETDAEFFDPLGRRVYPRGGRLANGVYFIIRVH